MKILVTGASGNVGAYVVKYLKEMGQHVVAAGTRVEKLIGLYGDAVLPVKLDFEDQTTFDNALDGIETIFFMRPPHLGNPEDLYPFLDAVKRRGVKLIVFLSLMGVEKNPFPPHHKIEKRIESLGIPYTHIRPGFFMQNLLGVHLEEIIKKREIFIPAGRSKTSFIDAEDIGMATAMILSQPEKHQNKAYTLTGGESLDYKQIADILSSITGEDIRYANPGLLHYRKYYIKHRNLDPKYVNVTVGLYLMTRLGTAKDVTDTFFELTGKRPTTFRKFAEKHNWRTG